MLKKFIFVILSSFALYGCGDDKPEEIHNAEVELWSSYQEAGIYSDLTCRPGNFDGNWVMYCKDKGGDVGGLYELKSLGKGTYQILSLNATAISDAATMSRLYHFYKQSTVDVNKVIRELS
ncbi:hypothetical protein [Vibrio aestuarianus]|uniref:hypothetical protein n=1 Tax=Vibrio aestuarianus TaxID=28171 RepID=UPI00237CF008|nr:hypothetical protein [Vibrio aestuarianus]MDE1333286.1 hypothetical protein [Vibrio aestuarianus]